MSAHDALFRLWMVLVGLGGFFGVIAVFYALHLRRKAIERRKRMSEQPEQAIIDYSGMEEVQAVVAVNEPFIRTATQQELEEHVATIAAAVATIEAFTATAKHHKFQPSRGPTVTVRAHGKHAHQS